ncbi:MAG: protein-methionine-sulfoxide reductase heme-binding subunit MsrQ [Steroidobacteraceae bacterium]
MPRDPVGRVFKPAAFLAALLPLALTIAGALGIAGASLGADPVEKILVTFGKTALNLLLLTLACSPLRELTGSVQWLRFRRMLGLFAFSYALLHLLSYAVLDLGLDFRHLGADIVKRPFITIGFIALLAMLPMAATSTARAMRRLGRRWQRIHYLVYPVAILGVWHYWWQVKADVREPLVYATLLTLLLGWRLVRRRRRATSTSGSATAPGRT